MEKLALNVKETAEVLGISLTKCYALVRRRDFPSIQVGSRWLVPADALKAWLMEQAQEKGSL
jgi:excisionase family DNA binding protein